MDPPRWHRRARPLLGTLVEIGVPAGRDGVAGFAALEAVQGRLSRFVADSDVARFAALPAGASLAVHPDTAELLAHAAQLHQRSEGTFDITLGSGPTGWHLTGTQLHKRQAGVTFDLGGIGKGHAVDRAVAALQAAGIAHGWVNAGGDLRVFGDVELPVQLRNEAQGGTVHFVHLAEGALATSHYAPGSRCTLHGPLRHAHVSVAAPTCRWADALTKLAASVAPPVPLPVGAASAAIRGLPPIATETTPSTERPPPPAIPSWWPQLMDDVGATAWWH